MSLAHLPQVRANGPRPTDDLAGCRSNLFVSKTNLQREYRFNPPTQCKKPRRKPFFSVNLHRTRCSPQPSHGDEFCGSFSAAAATRKLLLGFSSWALGWDTTPYHFILGVKHQPVVPKRETAYILEYLDGPYISDKSGNCDDQPCTYKYYCLLNPKTATLWGCRAYAKSGTTYGR